MSFSVKGCRIIISYYFFAMLSTLLIMCHDLTFLCGLAAAAVHELGHIIAIVCCRGASVRQITVGALGIKMSATGALERPVIILAGVTANIILAIICLPAFCLTSLRQLCLPLAAASVCLALCNILPIEPLDGGALLRCLAERRLAPQTADRTVFCISLCALVPLTAVGLYAVMQSQGNFSLLILTLWLLAGILKRYI